MIIKFKKNHPDAIVPTRNSDGDAAYDLYSVERAIIGPMNRACISTGLSIEEVLDRCMAAAGQA